MSAYEEFFTELVRLEIDLWDRLEKLHASQGVVSVAQLQALRAIGSARGSARVQDISTELQITVGAASKLVDRLERDGLAARAAHPSDRRSMIISLTASGVIALKDAAAASDQSLTKLLSGILHEEQATELAATLFSARSSLSSGSTASPSSGASA